MNNERLYQVLQGPVFSEKAQVLGETAGVQVFKVALGANKLEIKKGRTTQVSEAPYRSKEKEAKISFSS